MAENGVIRQPKHRREMLERLKNNLIKSIYDHLNENDGKSIFQKKHIDQYAANGIWEELANNPNIKVSEPFNYKGLGESIIICKKVPAKDLPS